MDKRILVSKNKVRNNNLCEYVKVIEQHIKENRWVWAQQFRSLAEIFDTNPAFTHCGVKTWIIRGNRGYQILWRDSTDWNVGFVDPSLEVFNFRDCPKLTSKE